MSDIATLDPTTGVWAGESEGVLPIGVDGKETVEKILV
jgi:hypothetical protein